MTRVTKVGLWLIPWFLLPVGFVLWVLSEGSYPATGASIAIDHYRRWIDPLPYQELVIWIVPVVLLLSIAAFVIGSGLLLISLVRKRWKKQALKT